MRDIRIFLLYKYVVKQMLKITLTINTTIQIINDLIIITTTRSFLFFRRLMFYLVKDIIPQTLAKIVKIKYNRSLNFLTTDLGGYIISVSLCVELYVQ